MCLKKEELQKEFEKMKKGFIEEFRLEHKNWEDRVYKTVMEHTQKIHTTSPDTDIRLKKVEAALDAIVEYNSEMKPILEGLHNAFVGSTFIGKVLGFVAKFIVTTGIIITAIYAIKDWIKK